MRVTRDPTIIHTIVIFALLYDLLAFIASSFRVAEENWLSKIDLSGPPSFFWNVLLLLKELIFTFYLLSLQLVLCRVEALKSGPVYCPYLVL